GESFFEVVHRRFKIRPRPLRIGNLYRGREQDGAARNADAETVRRERDRSLHFGEALAVEQGCFFAIAVAEGFPGSKQKAGSMPHQRLGVIRILSETGFTECHRPIESGFVAGKAAEHVFAHQIIKALGYALSGAEGCHKAGEAERDQPRWKFAHLPFSLALPRRNSVSRCAT